MLTLIATNLLGYTANQQVLLLRYDGHQLFPAKCLFGRLLNLNFYFYLFDSLDEPFTFEIFTILMMHMYDVIFSITVTSGR